MHFRFDRNILLLWMFLVLQVLVFVCYLSFSFTWKNGGDEKAEKLPQSVKFVGDKDKNLINKLGLDKFKTYYNSDVDEEIYLSSENVDDYYLMVNDTICFKYGTDLGYMQRNSETIRESGKCECLPGYHGNDCSLPEVIWRAFIASRKETVIHKRNGKMRRIVHMFTIAHPAQIQQTIIEISELFNVVDLFIVFETNRTEFGGSKPFYFKQKLDKGLLKNMQYKILYTPIFIPRSNVKTPYRSVSELAWEKSREIIKNLRDDDLFVQLNNSEIPNPKALLFFKLFDGFSLPIHFRLKWNVYGYYFQHPNKTKTVTTGCSIRTLDLVYKNNPSLIEDKHGLIVGDLNHYGGWYCDLCYDPNDILNVIQTLGDFEDLLSKSSNVVDVKYLEELIGDGRYVDGKTDLIKNHEERDSYFAPSFVMNNSWKYDSLLINFYNKIDYN